MNKTLLSLFRTANGKKDKQEAMKELGYTLADFCYNLEEPLYFKPSEKKVISIFSSVEEQESFSDLKKEAASLYNFLKALEATARGKERSDWFYDNIKKLKNVDSAVLATRLINGNIGEGCGRSIAIDVFGSAFKEFSVSKAAAINRSELSSLSFADGVLVQEKLDGFRCNLFITVEDEKAVNVFAKTANGNIFDLSDSSKLAILSYCNNGMVKSAEHLMPGNLVLDGEAIAKDGLFSSTASIMQSKAVDTDLLNFKIFDVFPCEGTYINDEFVCNIPLTKRLAVLNYAADNDNVQTLQCTYLSRTSPFTAIETVVLLFESVVHKGGEGVMLKYIGAPFKAKRTKDCFKLKIKDTKDLAIVEVTSGTGKYEGKIGALIVNNDGKLVNVGTGLSDEFRNQDPTSLVGRIIEVEYMEETADKSLRMPRFKRFRDTDQKPGVKI